MHAVKSQFMCFIHPLIETPGRKRKMFVFPFKVVFFLHDHERSKNYEIIFGYFLGYSVKKQIMHAMQIGIRSCLKILCIIW